MGEENWEAAWQPVIDRIGTDIGAWAWRGADAIDRSAIRRYCEVLELDCPLHHDDAVAREHGEPGVVAPVTSMFTFAIPPMWEPGDEPLFHSDERDAQPRHSELAGIEIPGAPPTSGFFATDIEADYVRMPRVGERLRQTGLRLLSCSPKETAVGRGAFMTFESEVRTDPGDELLATTRISLYSYEPKDA
jgi:hypothetical protein